MNLELLDPFQRQIPDRVDATLNLPKPLHSRNFKKTSKKDNIDDGWKAANHVAFNRRGAYVAVGYGSGTVAVYDVLSRTLRGLYRSGNSEEKPSDTTNPSPDHPSSSSTSTMNGHGVTSLSWSRRSRTLLAGAAGDVEVRLIDTTHPSGPEECSLGIKKDEKEKPDVNRDEHDAEPFADEGTERKRRGNTSSFLRAGTGVVHHRKPRDLQISAIVANQMKEATPSKRTGHQSHTPVENSKQKRYPCLRFKLPLPIGSTLQIHPKDTCAGLAALNDGSLVAFWVPVAAWQDQESDEEVPSVKVVTIHKSEELYITCAAFDPHGDKIYAATTSGRLLGFEVAAIFDHLASRQADIPLVKPGFVIHIPGGATVWHLIVSRNGRNLVVNSADAAIRLYPTKECWTTPEEVEKPSWVFQDVVSKVKFASCDFSGDGEYVMGGTNGSENKYELYIWNASTGRLMDKLTGAPVDLYSVAWHPTRSFLAVAASDGLVDIWGPRINWTAFAPDFQALPQNVEYVECEDEFDTTEDDNGIDVKKKEDEDEVTGVDILSVDPVPVFASDSENEEDVFNFETKVKRIFGLYTS